MIKMSIYDDVRKNSGIFTWEEKAQMVEFEHKQALKRMREEGFQEGLQLGYQEGIQLGEQDMVRTMLLAKYGIADEEWINSLNKDKIDTLIKAFFTTNTLDELKQIVDNN